MTDTVTPRASTGRLIVNPGDMIASQWGNTTFDQTMEVFDTALSRDSQWPTPHDGALCYTIDAQLPWIRRSGAWQVLYGPPPAVTAGSGVQTFTDQSGEIWVAKGSLAAGAWRKARDVLHASAYRAAAFNIGTAPGAIGMDTPISDPFAMHNAGTGVTTLPAGGLWQIHFSLGANSTATGQFLQSQLASAGGTLIGMGAAQSSMATVISAIAQIVRPFNPGDTITTRMLASVSLTGRNVIDTTRLQVDYLGTG
jgi:hypothetical protein